MSSEAAAIRPLVESELQQPMLLCKCGKSRPLYVTRWLHTKQGSRSYKYAGGRAGKLQMSERLCPDCAKKWATDNDLRLCAAPLPDPAPGQLWRQVDAPHTVVVVNGWVEEEFGRRISFEPPLPNPYGREIDSLQPHRFLQTFDPICDEVIQ